MPSEADAGEPALRRVELDALRLGAQHKCAVAEGDYGVCTVGRLGKAHNSECVCLHGTARRDHAPAVATAAVAFAHQPLFTVR
eukprot:SAG22_NODE_14818_length_364_cov_0.777358_1_plen_82_part_10